MKCSRIAAVRVDDLDIFLRNGRRTVQNDRESGKSSGYFLKDVQTKLGIRAGFELVSAVACADRDRQRVNSCSLNELFDLVGICEHSLVGVNTYSILDAGECSELSLNYYAVLVSIVSNLLGLGNVFLKIVAGIVDHDRCKSAVYAFLADLEVCAVIQVQSDRDLGIQLNSCFNELLQINGIRILSCTCRCLKDDGRLELSCSLCNTLYDLHVVDIKCADSVSAVISLFEHFCGCY